jgi:serine/threonine protein kinase
MDSLSAWCTATRPAFPETQPDPFNDFLGVIDIDFLTACEFSNFHKDQADVGKRMYPSHSYVLGEGGTYIVRRIPYDSLDHQVSALHEPWESSGSKFVVLKQQKVIESSVRVQDIDRLRSAMMEMKILRHEPIRKHPNIIKLLQMRWDVQDDFDFVLPSVVMEYGDFGTLADFQDSEILTLSWGTKKKICVDIARGLQVLHDCGIVHGDVKSE